MTNWVISIINKIGIDKSIAYASSARIIQGFTGVVSIFFISTFLTGVEQGFYFTFGSILALQVFFELGLTSIMTQYVAHEAAHLELGGEYEYFGEYKYRSRLASLLHFCFKWYSILSIIVFLVLLVIGYVYFSKYGDSHADNISWKFPWLLICIGTALKLFQSPFTSIITGLGYVKEMSRVNFYQQLIIPLCTWLGLSMGLKLSVMGLGYLVSVLIWFYFVSKDHLVLILLKLWRIQIIDCVSYLKEIFPFQLKIALSWVSGYFTYQLFNPVLFATEGPEIAGQMGMTLQVLNAVIAFSFSWQNTKIPRYSGFIASKQYSELDSLFRTTTIQMLGVCAVLVVGFIASIVFLQTLNISIMGVNISERFLPFEHLLMFSISVIFQQLVASWAVYTRCHKKEPYLIYSIVSGGLCLISTLVLGNYFGLDGITIGYTVITCLLSPWAYIIYKFKKIEWHEKS